MDNNWWTSQYITIPTLGIKVFGVWALVCCLSFCIFNKCAEKFGAHIGLFWFWFVAMWTGGILGWVINEMMK